MSTNVRGYSTRSGPSGSHTEQNDIGSSQEVKKGKEGEPVPKKAKSTRPLPSGPSLERLLAHANAFINKVSNFVTKPVNAKYGNKDMTPTVERPKRNVGTPSVSTEQPHPVETEDTPTHNKLARTIKCKICKESFGSIKKLNDHRAEHRVVDCV